ncbi:MAG: hypothetical protein DRG83_21020 [Deltaproteobacteria bacterium]|nr:MAG: hypothetical protein DRG83_21020 [Deltaproteobacteria bacterium]
MWNLLEKVARFLNSKFIGSVKIGTVLTLTFLFFGVWLLITSGWQLGRVILGGFMTAIAVGYFWIMLSTRIR